jgi:hypothetical protein
VKTHFNIVFSFFLLVLAGSAQAQTSLTADWRHASLSGWQQNMETALFDRSSYVYGEFSERGWYPFYIPKMNDEYHLNLFSHRFNPTQDFIFYRSPNGIRVSGGELNTVGIHSRVEMKNLVEVRDGHNITFYALQENNFGFQRLYAKIGYQFAGFKHQKFGIEHTISEKRTDLDIQAYYQIGDEQNGYIKTSFALNDYLNNLTYRQIKFDFGESYSDTSRTYKSQPGLLQFQAETPSIGQFRAQLSVGYQFETDSEISSLTIENVGFRHREKTLYYGGLLEYTTEFVTFGSIYRHREGEVKRDSVSGSIFNPRYTTDQSVTERAFYILANSDDFFWESWFWMNLYEDNQNGERIGETSVIDRLYNHEEEQLLIRNRLMYRPEYSGILAGVEHILDRKSFSSDLPNFDAPLPDSYHVLENKYEDSFAGLNQRLLVILGYQFHPRALIEAGVGIDIDNDLHATINGARYDEAFVRFDIRW